MFTGFLKGSSYKCFVFVYEKLYYVKEDVPNVEGVCDDSTQKTLII